MSLRITKQRQELIDFLRTRGGAWSAAQVKSHLPHLDLATIYRNLERFTTEGLIKKLYLTDGEALFEYQATPHHHAICRSCHKIIHLDVPETKLQKLIQLNNFEVDAVDIIVRGTCH